MKLQDFDFRVWNKKSNFYVEKTCGNIISIASDSSLEYNARENKILAVEFSPYDSMPLINKNYTEDDYEIELFTGLYDKNGKKIYENDIITLCHFAQKCIGVVRFGRNGFVITSKDENAEQGGELSYFE
ncbi:YopX family protein, partial [Campylobacter lari]|nr:YopX family protein [Campylobacter lari]